MPGRLNLSRDWAPVGTTEAIIRDRRLGFNGGDSTRRRFDSRCFPKNTKPGLATIVRIPLTTNLQWAEARGNILLTTRTTNLPKDSVANTSQVLEIDRALLTKRSASSGRLISNCCSPGSVVLGR
jgi:hypothetical protein